jgi:hypothetical protein
MKSHDCKECDEPLGYGACERCLKIAAIEPERCGTCRCLESDSCHAISSGSLYYPPTATCMVTKSWCA